MSKNNGGPEFPGLHPSKECRYSDEGMTLRDYFAAKAMQGNASSKFGEMMSYVEIAKWSYKMADAMLKERDK